MADAHKIENISPVHACGPQMWSVEVQRIFVYSC